MGTRAGDHRARRITNEKEKRKVGRRKKKKKGEKFGGAGEKIFVLFFPALVTRPGVQAAGNPGRRPQRLLVEVNQQLRSFPVRGIIPKICSTYRLDLADRDDVMKP